MSKLLPFWFVCSALLFLVLPSWAEESTTDKNVGIHKLNDIHTDLLQRRNALDQLDKESKKVKTVADKERIQAKQQELEAHIAEQQRAFELIVTGGAELTQLERKHQKEQFDWQKELLEILQPIMAELRKMTEQQRKREQLLNRIAFHESQTKTIEKALSNLITPQKGELQPGAQKRFDQIISNWKARLQEHHHLLEVDYTQLNNLKHAEESAQAHMAWSERFAAFSKGRGLTLLIAIATAVAVFFVMRLLQTFTGWVFYRKKNHKRRKIQRLISLAYRISTVILSIVAVFYVFNIRNDRALQAMAILILVALIWILRTSIPRFVAEMRLLLNLGEVREGERIVYNGLPWEVVRLNIYATLHNPCVGGEYLKVPLQAMLDLRSRAFQTDELWFPCQCGDYVLLSDGLYGQVLQISCEYVLLRVAGGSEQRYGVEDFLAANPRNLSKGFGLATTFGIDYANQNQATGSVPDLFQAGIEKGLFERYGENFQSVSVSFEAAGASSLDYKIFAVFSGEMAEDYFPALRDLQRLAVDVCNEQGWDIPFNQLVIHQGGNS